MLRLLEAIAENYWLVDHGGREIYRRLLTGVLEALDYARAEDWLDILAFPTKAIEWSDADAEQLQTALRRYKQKGARDERYDCTTVDELTGLRESLSKLCTEYGLGLSMRSSGSTRISPSAKRYPRIMKRAAGTRGTLHRYDTI